MHRLIVILAVVMLTGCATEAKYKNMANSWIGQPKTKLIDRWGYPNSVLKIDGKEVYSYTKTHHSQGVGMVMPGGIVVEGADYVSSCTTSFEITSERVSGWKSRGNCKSL